MGFQEFTDRDLEPFREWCRENGGSLAETRDEVTCRHGRSSTTITRDGTVTGDFNGSLRAERRGDLDEPWERAFAVQNEFDMISRGGDKLYLRRPRAELRIYRDSR